MITATVSGTLHAMYGNDFGSRRYVAKDFASFKKYFDDMRKDEWYGVMEIKVHQIDGLTWEEITANKDWFSKVDYYFYEVE